jgi:hypothetical protein
MSGKTVVVFALLVVLLGTVTFTALAEISVGVKTGDWIEYKVSTTGTPPASHDISWARMDIVNVQGKKIDATFSTLFSDGTTLNETATLNLETGQLGDDFIIPANLNQGDSFFDKNIGNIAISGVEERTYAGVTRTVVSGATPQTVFYWDKSTGVLVEGRSTFTDFTLTTITDKTDLWSAQILGLEPVVFYALLIVVVAILVIIAILVLRRKK